MLRMLIGALALMATACADLPRDPERTEALVRESGTIRLGWVTGAEPEPAAAAALQKVSSAIGAQVERREGDSEALLADLEDGKIDLVFGAFAMASPWHKKVHLGRALSYRAEPPGHVAAPRFAYRNGENGWIMRVEQAAQKAQTQ